MLAADARRVGDAWAQNDALFDAFCRETLKEGEDVRTITAVGDYGDFFSWLNEPFLTKLYEEEW